jgi:hypothetical protein
MPEKRETLEEFARREADAEREREEARANFVASRELLSKEVPERFFTLALELREAVKRFNSAAADDKKLTWSESSALAARDKNLQADFSLEFGRKNTTIQVALNAMSRSGGPDVFLIEASGQLRDDRFMLRVEGWAEKSKKVTYRISVNFKRMSWPIEELAERLVLACVKSDFNVLYKP